TVGVENPAGNGTTSPLFGQVWVNELRVIEVDDTPGWAYRFDANLKIADLGNVTFNYSKIDPNFHSIDQRFGSRQTGVNWGINASMELGKFFPEEWTGTTLPISYAHSENIVRPKYLPNSDVLVGEAADRERQRLIEKGYSSVFADASASDLVLSTETYRVTDTWSAPNFRIGLPSDEWWIRDTWNKLSFGFNYTRSTERNPSTSRRLSWLWNARIQYQLRLSPDYYFQPFTHIFEGIWLLDEYKDLKIWYAPETFNWSFTANRSKDISLQRLAGAQELTGRNFNASRSFSFNWKLTENGLLNPSGDYTLNVESSLLDLETDPITKSQRSFSKILNDIFLNNSLINFGKDTRYSQRNNFNTKPNIPNIFNIKKYLDLTLGYSVDYNWQNALTQGDLGKSAGFGNNINLSMNFKLKSLFDPLFESSATPAPVSDNKFNRGRTEDRTPESENDSIKTVVPDSTTAGPHGLDKTMAQLKELARLFIKVPFLDYETIGITFTQTNQAGNSGIVGRPGFVNFWGRVPFFQDADPKYGPSRLYQLGLISDPHGKLTNFSSRSKFPFFGWDVEPGVRAANGVLQNTYRQTNRLSFKTSRGLWEGARLDLNWNVGWSYNRSQSITTDSLGRIIAAATQNSTSGSVDRSFLSLPDVLFLGVFKSNLKEVSKRYAALKANKADSATVSDEEKISKAFEEGFEALPFFRKVFGQFAPRVNWSLHWDGLEKIPMFSGFVSRLSLDHTYTSNYTRSFENRQGGLGEKTTGQRISYSFAPLVGMNFTFKDLLKGNMGANVRYNTTTMYDLATSSRNLVETLAQEISFTASYSRRGFEIPFFGLTLNNDLEINASYSLTKNSKKQYEISKLDVNVEGTPLEGSTRTVFEPRVKYVLSQRVNASVYYRLTKITPDAQGSNIPGSTTNEAGLDIHIAIQ
ncbi:MAG: cell surface protein SprA, partial [bacterium]